MRDADGTPTFTPRDDTPARLIAAAEQLFADGGEEATSLRAVSRAAHSNAAAVHYHFGGRDELLRAVIARHLEPLNARRFELLEEARRAHGEPVPVAAIVTAVVRPDLELLAELAPHGVRVARLVGRAPALRGTAPVVARLAEALEKRALPMLRASLPEVPTDQLRQRLRLVGATASAVLAAAPDPGEDGPLDAGEPADSLAGLVAFCSAGLAAPAAAASALMPQPSALEPRSVKKRKKH